MLEAERMQKAELARASELGQRMLAVLAGEQTEVALLAASDVLATLIGAVHYAGGRHRDEALDVADECAVHVEDHIRLHWGRINTRRLNG